MSHYGGYFAIVGSFIVLPIFSLIFAALYWVVFNTILGGTATFKQVLAVVAHSQVVAALGAAIGAPIQYLQGKMPPAGRSISARSCPAGRELSAGDVPRLHEHLHHLGARRHRDRPGRPVQAQEPEHRDWPCRGVRGHCLHLDVGLQLHVRRTSPVAPKGSE